MANNTLKLAFILSATDKMSRIVDEAVKKSTDKLSAFERTTSKIGRSMMNAGTVMAGAGAAVGASIFAVGKASADYAGDMFDMARSTGMGVESFQKIAYAAKMSGIEAEKVTTSFIKFDKMIVDAPAGTRRTCRRLRISAFRSRTAPATSGNRMRFSRTWPKFSTTRKMEPRKRHWQSSYSESRAPR